MDTQRRGVAAINSSDDTVSRRDIFKSTLERLSHPLTFTCWLCASVMMALTGPFGTYGALSFVDSLLMWSLLIAVPLVLSYVVFAALCALMWRYSTYTVHGVFVVVGVLLNASVLKGLMGVVVPGHLRTLPQWWHLVGYTALVYGSLTMIRAFLPFNCQDSQKALPVDPESAAAAEEPAPEVEGTSSSRLSRRLGVLDTEQLLRISASGHYIDIVTSHRILRKRMRFSDALLDAEPSDGLCVHRSHWVAFSAIAGWVPDALKPVLIMTNGETIPVSKTYRAGVEQADLTEMALDQLS